MIRPRLQPLVDALKDRLKRPPVLHADETPVAQLDPHAGTVLTLNTKTVTLDCAGHAGASPTHCCIG